LDEIDDLLSGLSAFNDDVINESLSENFPEDSIMSDLDASGLCVLLINKKDNFDGRESTWFDMESV